MSHQKMSNLAHPPPPRLGALLPPIEFFDPVNSPLGPVLIITSIGILGWKKLSSDFPLSCCLCAQFFWEAAGDEEGVVEELQNGGAHHLLHRVLHTVRRCCQVEKNMARGWKKCDTKYLPIVNFVSEKFAPPSMRRSARTSRFQGERGNQWTTNLNLSNLWKFQCFAKFSCARFSKYMPQLC